MKILNLHSHSEFSNVSCGFKDSINKLEDLLNYAYDNGHAGVGLTDHESVSGHLRAFNWYKNKMKNADEAEQDKLKNFQIILGNEVYIARKDLTEENHKSGEKFHHFILLALDEIGQAQIRELSSRAWSRSYYRNVMRRFNFLSDFEEVIGDNKGHIVATTACLANPAGNIFMNIDGESRDVAIETFLSQVNNIFGSENFFVELAASGYKDQISYNRYMYDSFKDKYNFVITNDVHYLDKKDFATFKVFMKSANKGETADEFYRYSHFMSYEEIVDIMKYLPKEFIDTAMQNALDIGKKSSYYSLEHKTDIPKVPNEEKEIPQEFIEYTKKFDSIQKMLYSDYKQDRIMARRVINRYIEKENDTPERREKIFNRVDLEWFELLGISEIQEVRLSDYLLTVEWLVSKMWEAGSLVGPGRGSAVAFVTNYYLEITDVNPVDYPLDIPYWRFLSADRPEFPDIDIDTPGADRDTILKFVEEEFAKFGGHVSQVQTYGTESGRKALRTIAKGLDISSEVVSFVSSLITSERGVPLTLSQMYYGDDDHKPNKEFVAQMEEYPEWWEHVEKIEGLITQMGTHAGGIILSNEPIHIKNSLMKTKNGVVVTAYDLHESEDTGLIKYDALSVDGLGKLKTAIYLLLQDNKIEWQGDLRSTFQHYFSPKNLKPTQEVWDNISSGEINSLFQLNTPVGQSAIRLLKVKSVQEMGMINSLMRLQPQTKGERPPIDVFHKYRANINEWYNEMKMNGLRDEEIAIMEKHLLPLSGVSDTQESVMLMAMDKNIAGFSVKEAHELRKSIARKNPKAQEEIRQKFYKSGLALGNSQRILDYVWNVQIRYQLG